MKILKVFFSSLVLLTVFIVYIFFNLGNILDISEEPKKSDLIISLGGGDLNRIKKSFELYQSGYSIKKIIILTGDERSPKDKDKNSDDKRIKYLKENHLNTDNIIHEETVKNTIEEIHYIKEYMIKKQYISAIIVSDPPHTKRIRYLLNKIHKSNDDNLSFTLVKSDVLWWNKEIYYKNKKAQMFALSEYFKLIYSYFIYEIAEPLGFVTLLNEKVTPKANEIRKEFDSFTYKYLKN
jgi:uncharacterized SAM-binding protein YcdF (DUF218 family)